MSDLGESLFKLRNYNTLISDGDEELAVEAADLRSSDALLETASPHADSTEQEVHAESIVMRRFRPVLRIHKNIPVLDFKNETDSVIWKKRLTEAQSSLEAAIEATGRINLMQADYAWVGTGWLVRENIIVTNRHVAELFVTSEGATFTFAQGDNGSISAGVDFLAEFENTESREFLLVRPLYIVPPPGPDIAFFEAQQTSGDDKLAKPISLSKAPKTNNSVATIGYPAYDSRIPEVDLMRRIYGDQYDKKRLAPGGVTQVDELHLLHNCTTLGGNSGSAVIDLKEGHALGLHFSGAFMRTNYAVRGDIVERVLDDVLAGYRPFFNIPMQTSNSNDVANTQSTKVQHRQQLPVDHFTTTASITVPLTISVSLDPTAAKIRSTQFGTHAFPAHIPQADDDDIEIDTEAKPEDYRDRKGFKPEFIGDNNRSVTLPTVSKNTDQVLDFEFDGETMTELRYQNFSVVMNRSRRLCIFSAVNIDGKQNKKAKRKGWRLDPRIPESAQIIKECYGNPPYFSRGHMTRRNDPSWGDEDMAKLGNRDSMHVTNAAPQMQAFNSPIWLELEDYALENAIKDGMRISVLTGPYFNDDDPTRFGVKIPVSFWKVIAFVHDETGRITATGYEMDQSATLQPQEEFVFGDFQSFHTNVSAQVSIRSIEKKSGLSFNGLADRDPLSSQEGFGGLTQSIKLLTSRQIQYF